MSIQEHLSDGAPCLPGDVIAILRGDVTAIAGRGVRSAMVPVQRQRRNDDDGGEQEADTASSPPVKLVATVCGTLRRSNITLPGGNNGAAGLLLDGGGTIFQYEVVSPSARRYMPEPGDWVVGVIAKVIGGGSYQVHIGAPHLASLESTAFDGASKHSRPRLVPGDLVYAHVARAEPGLEVVLSCCSLPHMERKDWVTGEGTFGPLSGDGSAMVRVPLHYARELVSGAAPVLSMLGRRVEFEAAVGVNGVVFVAHAVKGRKKIVAGAAASSAAAAGGGGAAAAAAAAAASSAADAGGAAAAVVTAQEEWRAVRILAAIAQCIVYAEYDHTADDCQRRVDGYFPPQ